MSKHRQSSKNKNGAQKFVFIKKNSSKENKYVRPVATSTRVAKKKIHLIHFSGLECLDTTRIIEQA